MASQEQYKAALDKIMLDAETGAISKEVGIDMVQKLLEHWYKNWADGTLVVEADETPVDFITDTYSNPEDVAYEDVT